MLICFLGLEKCGWPWGMWPDFQAGKKVSRHFFIPSLKRDAIFKWACVVWIIVGKNKG